MAQNVARNRQWINQTYASSPERDALQQWVDDHPEAIDAGDISTGLQSLMNDWDDAQKARLSLHFSGQAFDVRPTNPAYVIKKVMRGLPHLLHFFDTEGGLTIWHADFARM